MRVIVVVIVVMVVVVIVVMVVAVIIHGTIVDVDDPAFVHVAARRKRRDRRKQEHGTHGRSHHASRVSMGSYRTAPVLEWTRPRTCAKLARVSDPERPCRLFIYGTLLPGERDHALLKDAELIGSALTEPGFELVDLGQYAVLVPGGKVAVQGEVYAASLETRRAIDVARQVPILFQRGSLTLADGTQADAYFMPPDPVRGKRRLGHGDWKKRFAPAIPHRAGGPLVSWAKARFDK